MGGEDDWLLGEESERSAADRYGRPVARATTPRSAAAMFAYLFIWLGGLIIFLMHRDREVRFHAAQSVLLFGGMAVLTSILSIVPTGGAVIPMILWLLFVLSFTLWVFLSIQGYQLRHVMLPVIGRVAERWADDLSDDRPAAGDAGD